jgi:Tol biopolymer transport system component
MKRLISLGFLLLLIGCGAKMPQGADITPIAPEGARDENPSISPDGSMVAFWRMGGSGGELWVADRDLGNARKLGPTSLFAGNTAPIWSPNGSELLIPASMRSLADVAIVAVADGQVTWLTDRPVLEVPTQFHPDGDRIVYVAYTNDGSIRTFTVSRSTREIVPLVADLEEPFIGMVSPDGSHIAYTELSGSRSTIWVASADGGNRQQLTTDGYEFTTIFEGPQGWSPDGREFLFTSTRTGKADIWIGNVDGSVRQLTSDINSDNTPSFSHDGQWVAFHSERGRQGDIWIVPAAGGDAIRVTDDLMQEERVRWTGPNTLSFIAANSPGSLWLRRLDDGTETRLTVDTIDAGSFVINRDRTRIAYLVDLFGNNSDLALMELGTGATRLVSRAAQHLNLSWDPSGTRLAFTTDQAGSADVYVVSATDDEAPRRLIDWPGFEQVIGWSGDGSGVRYISDRETRLGDLWQAPLDGGPPVRQTRLGAVVGGITFSRGNTDRTLVVMPDSTAELVMSELLPDGSLRELLDGNPNGGFVSHDGELLGLVTARSGTPDGLVMRPDGTLVRVLGPGSIPQSFSRDGARVLFDLQAGSNRDLAIMDLATGTVTPVTNTPEDETHAEFSADEQSVVLRRVQITRRLMRADISALVGSP